MSDLRELYQELIIDHSKRPRNFKVLETANRRLEGYNPLCGDQFVIYLEMEGDLIKDVSFQGSGCGISKAAAPMMTAAVKGKTRQEAEVLFDEFHHMVKGELDPEAEPHHLGRLTILPGVRELPPRGKCARLFCHTCRSA